MHFCTVILFAPAIVVNHPRQAIPIQGQLLAMATGLRPSSYINSRGRLSIGGVETSSTGGIIQGLGAALSFAHNDVLGNEDIVITDGPMSVKASGNRAKKRNLKPYPRSHTPR
ncbi:hypothetical protein BJ138DRAFT_1102873 [Hygrophoropsis aurantiaca]|uniref:Uncharacterized protein n=1 Tax=Hygrophoropsis aurantiaca TaxID=72124 RepID=A0ACB8A7G2_9AGAM|nr:hypothetical protein BJ138DRAFT_1102873 [Hygrophoropsis aurantiaca]